MQPQEDQNYWQSPELPSSVPTTPPEVANTAPMSSEPITWQASEFIHHEKNGIWFLALLSIASILLLIDVFLIKSWTFAALIVVMAIAIVVVARRPPRTVTYTLSAQGLSVDEKHFSFHDFRGFGVVQEDAFHSIRLIPNKRFMPMVSVYFPTEQGEQIVDIFGAMLPMEQIELDAIDKLVEKIRF